MLRRLSVALLSACAFIPSAGAADLGGSLKDQPAYVAPFTWTGRYLGLNAGYGWGHTRTHVEPLPDVNTFFDLRPVRLNPNPDGALGGAQIGYNWQTGSLVFGAEADFQGANISGTAVEAPIINSQGNVYGGNGDHIRVHRSLDWFGTARLRAGITAWEPRVLLFATGGLAFGQVKGDANTDFRPTGTTQYPADFSDTRTGWVLGGGFEWAFNDNWSFKTEYLHMDFGSKSVTANPVPANPPFQVRYDFHTEVDVVRAGLNYKIR